MRPYPESHRKPNKCPRACPGAPRLTALENWKLEIGNPLYSTIENRHSTIVLLGATW